MIRLGRVCAGILATLILVVGAAGGLWASVSLSSGQAEISDFYSWQGEIPREPGTLLRSTAYDGQTPEGSTAYLILYSTTYSDGSAAVASAVVAVPDDPAEVATAVAWQHGTTGVTQGCAPSLTADALTEDSIPGIGEIVSRGWAVVATDYPGQGTSGKYPYLVGEGEGRATLDGVRAAEELLAEDFAQVMLWGHSQGGHATLWAAQIADSYAPELTITSVAALSSASDPLALAQDILSRGSSAVIPIITAYVLVPYAMEYDDIDLEAMTRPGGVVIAEQVASRCATSATGLVSVLSVSAAQSDGPLFDLDLSSGPAAERLAENIASGDFSAPLFLGQGTDDEVIPLSIQRSLAEKTCTAGHMVTEREYEGRTHMGVIASDSPLIDDLWSWVDSVLNGTVSSTC